MNSINQSCNIIGIGQREWGITISSSETPVIGTKYISCCVSIAVYNPISKIAALAHLDSPGFSENAVMEIIQSIPDTKELQITFVGGWEDNTYCDINRSLPKIIAQLRENNRGWKFDTTKLFIPEESRTYSYVGIDSRSGVVSADDRVPVFSKPVEMIHLEKSLEASFYNKPLEQTVNGLRSSEEGSRVEFRMPPKVRIITICGKEVSVGVSLSDTVAQLKEKIFQKAPTWFPPNQQRLIFPMLTDLEGKPISPAQDLKDDLILKDLGIVSGFPLWLVGKMPPKAAKAN